MTPTVFISYSWDNDTHKEWVKSFATQLRSNGIDVKLDQWETVPGDQLPHFMERSIRDNNYVLIICTPNYKLKSDNRTGGVGYEGDIMTAEVLTNKNDRKFIPILKSGSKEESIPSWIIGKYYVDLSNVDIYEKSYKDILTTILNLREKAPPIGKPPDIKPSESLIKVDATNDESAKIKIKGIVIDEITSPKNDGTSGSALYKIPFELTSIPDAEWSAIFLYNWNFPKQFSTMHRPGIATINGNKIYLDGTTIDEVEKYHRNTLVICLSETNKKMNEIKRLRDGETEKAKKIESEHRKNLKDISGRINFD
jgi:hypothetical protein